VSLPVVGGGDIAVLPLDKDRALALFGVVFRVASKEVRFELHLGVWALSEITRD
jgi:hypothetical protein